MQRQDSLEIDLGIEVVRNDDRGLEHAVVEECGGRDIAAAGRDQLQQLHRRLAAAIGQRRDGMAAKSDGEMPLRRHAVAEIG